MNKIIEYIIRAKDATGAGIGSALGKLKNFAKVVGTNLQNIRAGFEMLKGAASTFIGAMGKAFEFEKMTHQFKFLIGNMDEARDHMKMLQSMGDTPPFSLEEFAAASRSLMVLTDGALGFQKSLELVGGCGGGDRRGHQEHGGLRGPCLCHHPRRTAHHPRHDDPAEHGRDHARSRQQAG